MDPKTMRAFAERNVGAHRQDIGIDGHREHHGGKNREHFHRHIELVGEQGIVGGFQRFDSFFGAFQHIPDADVGTDQILEIGAQGRFDEFMFLGQ